MVAVPNRLTLDEFLRLPEEKPALEFSDGEVTQKVSPKTRHSALQRALMLWLSQTGADPVIAFPELRITLAGKSRVPDLSVFRLERIPLDSTGEFVEDLSLPPDVTVEIVSPEQSVNALVRRCLWYADNGVTIALLVDPADRSVLSFRPGDRINVHRGTSSIDLSDVLPGVHLTVDKVFAALRPEGLPDN